MTRRRLVEENDPLIGSNHCSQNLYRVFNKYCAQIIDAEVGQVTVSGNSQMRGEFLS